MSKEGIDTKAARRAYQAGWQNWSTLHAWGMQYGGPAIEEIERLRAELATETAWKDQWRGTAEKLGETIETLCADLAEARAELAKIHRSWGLIQESKGP